MILDCSTERLPLPFRSPGPWLYLALLAACAAPAIATAQGDSIAPPPSGSRDAHVRPPHYWRDVTEGFAASLLAHEAAHVVTAYALGATPHFGFDRGRPTVYSGIDVRLYPHKQFLFSSMGLNVQAALDELILDVPHRAGSPFERGVLASGIATAVFYVTIGRTATVSDVDFMARTSSLNKTDITLIYGGVALLHTLRIRHDGRYVNFFARPDDRAHGGMRVGVQM